MTYLNKYNPIIPTQKEPLDERQVLNAAGGYVYEIDDFESTERFLVLGTLGGSMYEKERDLTKENLDAVVRAIKSDGERVVKLCYDVSYGGKATKNDMALFVLAMCMTHGNDKTKHEVERVYNNIARIGTHHLMFCNFVNNMRGWGTALKRTVAGWYESKDDDALAYQVIKYRNREKFTHKDVLSLCHGGRNSPLFRWIIGADNSKRSITRGINDNEVISEYDEAEPNDYPELLEGFLKIQDVEENNIRYASDLIKGYRLTHEMVPNHFKNSVEIWEALLDNMPVTATLRNLGKMSSLGMLKPFTDNTSKVLDKFTKESVKKARLHPLSILIAKKTYESGEGFKGKLSWEVNNWIKAHLEDVFYYGFDAIEPTGLNMMIGVDVSGSMYWTDMAEELPFPSCTNLTCAEVACVMAMATARTEKNSLICAFDTSLSQMPITRKTTLTEALHIMKKYRGGGTDCSQPMIHAIRNDWNNIDSFLVYTDNDTWAGSTHASQALDQYRQKTGRNSTMVVLSMLANDTTIADETKPYMLDIVGMSTDTPQKIASYLNMYSKKQMLG
jgi:60 kDa SS-A/Ro ribonucleoprotein